MITKTKSHITFKEFEKKANEVFEFGNDWGFYIDIETNTKLFDTNYVANKHKQKFSYYSNKKENIVYNKEKYKYDTNDRANITNNKNINDIIIYTNKDPYIIKFIKRFLIKYSCYIIPSFLLTYYLFKIKK